LNIIIIFRVIFSKIQKSGLKTQNTPIFYIPQDFYMKNLMETIN
jgi:hypothetical protein